MSTLMRVVALAVIITVISGQVEIYDTSKQQCCDGKVQDFTFDKDKSACCGQELYNKEIKACCLNQTVDYPNDDHENYACCWITEQSQYVTYQYQTQQCCNGQLVDKPDNQNTYLCCGTEVYDYATHTCCSDEVVELSDDMKCCGDKMVKIESGTSQECCGDQIIDVNKQICCSEEFYNGNEVIFKFKVQEKTSENDRCCGLEKQNNETEICCEKMASDQPVHYLLPLPQGLGKYIQPYCCGNVVLLNHMLARQMSGQGCCDGKNVESVTFDLEKEECCGGFIRPRVSDESEWCCWPFQEFYNSKTHTCTKVGVIPIPDSKGVAENEDYCLPDQY